MNKNGLFNELAFISAHVGFIYEIIYLTTFQVLWFTIQGYTRGTATIDISKISH